MSDIILMEDRYMSSILKQVRLNLNLTQKEASSYLGIPLRTFQNWEEGARVPAEWTIDLVVDELLNYYKEQEIKDKGGVYSFTMIKKKLGGVVNKYDISKIILFGSYAKGCAKSTSDIDLVVTTSLKGLAFYGLAQDLEELFINSDVISLHCPLTEETYHIIDEAAINKLKRGVILLNTSRGALVDAEALLQGIKSRKIGAACLDVYEEESDLFFEDNSGHIMEDDTLARLISMPNVIVTSHQAFLTNEALANIAETTIDNILRFSQTGQCPNEICYRGGVTEDCRSGKCF